MFFFSLVCICYLFEMANLLQTPIGQLKPHTFPLCEAAKQYADTSPHKGYLFILYFVTTCFLRIKHESSIVMSQPLLESGLPLPKATTLQVANGPEFLSKCEKVKSLASLLRTFTWLIWVEKDAGKGQWIQLRTAILAKEPVPPTSSLALFWPAKSPRLHTFGLTYADIAEAQWPMDRSGAKNRDTSFFNDIVNSMEIVMLEGYSAYASYVKAYEAFVPGFQHSTNTGLIRGITINKSGEITTPMKKLFRKIVSKDSRSSDKASVSPKLQSSAPLATL
eukprot:GHVT01066823.1.p1 GENE.GHVT01066823.1~~GHVT01066823.1.p1  ORF type:complete len:278 (-),score=-1.28 GHVT01066823.1:32-865(-)